MKDLNILELEFSDEDIFELLRDALEDITGYDGDITLDTELIDELGLDSLGFLDLFFTIQTSIQKEVTNEQMRAMIMEELGQHRNKDLGKLSDGEIDRILYPELKVQNFFNIIRKQLSSQIPTIDLGEMPNDFLASGNIDDFLKNNFDQLKQQQYELQIKQLGVQDERILAVVQQAFDAVDEETIRNLLEDREMIKGLVMDFMKERFDFRTTSNLRVYVSAAFFTENESESLLFGRNPLSEMFLLFVKNKRADFDVPDSYEFDQFMSNPKVIDRNSIDFSLRTFWESVLSSFLVENLVDIRKIATGNDFNLDPDVIAQELLSDEGIQQTIIEQLVQENIQSIFGSEIKRQTDMVDDDDIYKIVKAAFLGDEFIENKIQEVLGDQPMHGDVIEDFMRNNFDRIAMEESRRIVEDKELRNRLVQDYIKENYDPMEAMQLNTPEAMREIQQKITQKYMDDNMDEIISRYMNEYMNEMLESMPTEDDIEVHGDVQEDFMKKFAAHMEEEESDVHSDAHLSEVEKFTRRYNIKDQMIQVFIESNFEEFKAISATLESTTYNRQSLEKHVITKYPLRTSLYLFNYLYDKEYHAQLRQEFATHVIDGQSELIIEVVMKRQLEFMWDYEKQIEENEMYQKIFDEWFFNRLKKTADQISEQDIEVGLTQFLRNYEISIDSLVATLLDYPDARTRQRVYANFYNDPNTLESLKLDFLNNFLDYLEKEELENAYDWMELFFTYDSKHPLVKRQKIKQEEFWLEKLNKIKNTPEEDFEYSSDCEKPFSSLLQKKFIGAMLSRWIVEMSLEFLDNQKRRIKVNSSQKVKSRSAKEWLNKVRKLVPITRYENGSQRRLQKLLTERCDDGTYKFEMADALAYLDDHAGQFIEWLIELTPLQSWDWVQPKGIDKSIEFIDSLDLENKKAVVGSLLENSDKKEEWISAIIKKLFMPFVAKMTERNSDSWYKLVSDPLGEELASETLMEMLAESTSAARVLEEPVVKLNVDAEETPMLYAYLDYLSPAELTGMANLMSKIEHKMGMNTRSILKLAEKVVSSFTEFFEGELDAMEKELLSYGQQLILQKFDFLTADLVQQEFDQPENIKAVREEIEEGYKKEYAYDFFNVGLQSLVFRTKDANMEQQENQFRMFCRRRISDIIDRKAIEIKKDNLN